jgi:hypothetical protein
MNTLHAWAARHNISTPAIHELTGLLLTMPDTPTGLSGEAAAQQQVRLEASKAGARLFRNNVGAAKTDTGSFIRFGLANDSAALNSKVKSADLIGIRPVMVTREHLGKTIGQFVSREIKRPGWKYTGTEREGAQLRWIMIINTLGGDAAFTTGGF